LNARPSALRIAGVALALGGAESALGRAGNGAHSASSGASSTHHSGGSSVGGGGGTWVGIILLIVFVLVIRAIYRRTTRGVPVSQNPSQAGGVQAAQAALGVFSAALGASGAYQSAGAGTLRSTSVAKLPADLDTLRATDPGFELETFLQRAEMTFFLVKRGMQRNDVAAIRPFLNDALFAALSTSIEQSRSQHQHALLESLNVRAVHLLNVECTAQAQRIQIHFDLVYRAKTLDDSNRVVSDEREDRCHAERWTFARSATARTPVGGGVVASRCPACGAELQLTLDGACAHCRAPVTNGTVDWVVSEVQSAAYVGYSSDSSLAVAAATVAEGVAGLQVADPSFSLDAFQTRVKGAFLALQDAWCRQNLDSGRAYLSPGAYFAWRAQLDALAAEKRRNVMENLEVRSIQPIQVIHGRVFDDLTVRINAAAADYEVDADGRTVFGDRSVRPFTEDWTFQRSVGALTLNKPGTLENNCPCCGAPVSLNQIGECRYCKAAVASGKFDWVVSRIEQDDGLAGGRATGDLGAEVVSEVGGAIVGGLLSSVLAAALSAQSRNVSK
jgi:predicted lipid-binding transport protein (Tim44 family)